MLLTFYFSLFSNTHWPVLSSITLAPLLSFQHAWSLPSLLYWGLIYIQPSARNMKHRFWWVLLDVYTHVPITPVQEYRAFLPLQDAFCPRFHSPSLPTHTQRQPLLWLLPPQIVSLFLNFRRKFCSSVSSFLIIIFLHLFIFKWRITALQNCIGFYQTPTWISHRFAQVPHVSLLWLHVVFMAFSRVYWWLFLSIAI